MPLGIQICLFMSPPARSEWKDLCQVCNAGRPIQPRLLQAELPVKRDKHPLAFCVLVPRAEEAQKYLPHQVIPISRNLTLSE